MDLASAEELVKRFREGDRDAFSVLMERYQDRLYRLACVYLDCGEDASDAVQEVFVRAYTGMKGFGFRSHPFTWLYRTMKNVCCEFNRRSRRSGNGKNAVQEQAPDDPQGDAEALQTTREIHVLVARLPPRQRDVVMLRLFEDLSVEETASALGCRPGTVKALYHKAVNTLRGFQSPLLEGGKQYAS